MSGRGTGGGIDFQARVLAWVYVHILCGHPLSWTRLRSKAIPQAVSTETGTAGDDVVVELAGTNVWFDAQAKKGFSRGADFDSVIEGFISILAEDELPHCFLVVDRSSSGTIADELPEDLNRMRGGRFDGLRPIGEHVRSIAARLSGEHVLDRLRVVTMDLLLEGSAHQDSALQKLREVLEHHEVAPQVWEILIADAVRLIREAGRRDRNALVTLVESHGFLTASQEAASDLDTIGVSMPTTSAAGRSSDRPREGSDRLKRDSWAERLELAKRLIDEGHTSAAEPLLADLERDSRTAQEVRTGRELARLENLAGIAKLRGGHLKVALAHFRQAVALDPSYFAAYVNAAHVHLNEGDAETAFNLSGKAIELEPMTAASWAVLTQAATQLGREVDVPSELADNPDILAAKGRGAFALRDWDRGIPLLRRANQLSPTPDPQHLVTLASALAYKASEVSDIAEDALQEAAALSERALILLERSPNAALQTEALVIRGQALAQLGDTQAADETLAKAAEVGSGNWRPIYLLALARLEGGDGAGALRIIDSFPNGAGVGPVRVARARALALEGRNDESKAEIEHALVVAAGTDELQAVYAMAVETALLAEYDALAGRLLADPPPSLERSDLAVLRARLADRLGDWPGAEQQYEIAIASAKDARSIRVEFGIGLLRNGKPREAVVQFENVPQSARDAVFSKYLARALTEVGEWSRAATVAEDTLRSDPSTRWPAELLADIAGKRGDLARQQAILTELHERHPHEIRYLLQLIQVLVATNSHDAALPFLAKASSDARLTAYDRLFLAGLHIAAGQPAEALPLAFAALRAEPDNERVQVAYINVFLQHSEATPDLDVSQVGANTHVVLQDTRGQKTGYTIFDTPPTSAARGEYLSDDPAVQPLLGKRIGDKVVRRKGQLSEMEYAVVEIQSAYVSAFQRVLTAFHHQHPESTTIQSFHVGESPTIEDFAPIVASIEASNKAAKDVLDRYTEHGLPLGTLAEALGRPMPVVYATIAADRERLLFTEYSSQTAFDASVAIAHSSRRAVVTRSALVTLQELDLLEWAAHAGIAFIAPQSLHDDLQRERADLDLMPGRVGTLGSIGGRLIMQEDTEEDVRRHREARQQLVDWAASNVTTEPLPLEALDIDETTWPAMLGKASFDAYALASVAEAPLYCDDLGLRKVPIEKLRRPEGFSSVSLFLAGKAKGLLSPEACDALLVQLIQLNHFFVPVSATTLEAALNKSGYQIDAGVMRVFDRLRGEFSATPQAVGVSVELIRRVALSTGAMYLRMLVTLILECLSDGHSLKLSIPAFRQLVDRRLELLPLARDRVEEAVRDFLAARAVRLA